MAVQQVPLPNGEVIALRGAVVHEVGAPGQIAGLALARPAELEGVLEGEDAMTYLVGHGGRDVRVAVQEEIAHRLAARHVAHHTSRLGFRQDEDVGVVGMGAVGVVLFEAYFRVV